MVNLECMPLAANNVYFTDSFLQLPGKKDKYWIADITCSHME